jgi:hypothetical protein
MTFSGPLYDYLVVVDFEATCDEGENPQVTRANQEIIEFPWYDTVLCKRDATGFNCTILKGCGGYCAWANGGFKAGLCQAGMESKPHFILHSTYGDN